VYHDAQAADVDRAAALAWRDFDAYRHTTMSQRAAFLQHIAVEIESLGDTLIERVTAETGILAARASGELARDWPRFQPSSTAAAFDRVPAIVVPPLV
jgi:alpha-ketoglutaric semialdehyde dehydrogenase